jgi:hypothetical protein
MGKSKCKKVCDLDQICNPFTGRCVTKRKKQIVYNPFYEGNVATYGNENCGSDRPSVDTIFLDPLTLATRIKYCDVLPLKNIENILGPITYREYKIGNINISLFGERHYNITDCRNNKISITFDGFLKSLLTQHKDTFYDFFVEFYYTKDPNYAGLVFSDEAVNMNLIDNSFINCLKLDKRLCDYKNTRMHYIDYRQANMNDPVTKYCQKYTDIAYGKLAPLSHDFELMTYNVLSYRVSEYIKNDERLKKQIKNSYLPRDIYIKFLDDYIEKNKIRCRKKLILDIDDFIGLFSIIMDMYALSRIFRTFNVGDKQHPVTPKDIIIYVGNNHSNVYNDFFMNYFTQYIPLVTKIIDIPDNNTSCLNFSAKNKLKSVLFQQ